MHPSLKSFPPEFTERLCRIVPPGLMRDVARGYQTNRATTFRINSLKSDVSSVLAELRCDGVTCDPVRALPGAFTVTRGGPKKLAGSRAFREGWIYLQSLSSQLPPLVLDPRPGENILDLCAAPGGKTCQIATMMNGRGKITAVEPDPIRYERLKFNLHRQGVTSATTIRGKGEKLGRDYDGIFDRVLVDAPCSSEGIFNVNDSKGCASWSVDFVRRSAKIQMFLLKRALQCVKPGGVVVYSTCALSPEENESVVDTALRENSGVVAEEIPLKLPVLRPTLGAWDGQSYHPAVAKARRVYPSETWEGFFVCRLRYM